MSALTNTNDTNYAYGGAEWVTYGFEYWSNPDSRDDGFIEWVADRPVFRAAASAYDADPNVNISRRLVPEEPMVRSLLGRLVIC